MNIKHITKKTIKKAAAPISKKVYNIADNLSNEKLSIALEQINSLKKNISELKTENLILKDSLSDFESAAKYIFYYHGGSGNHGCEALVRTISSICDIPRNELGIYSYRPSQDREFGILDIASFIKKSNLDTNEMNIKYRSGTLALSIGGDNYCGYPIPQLAKYNRKFHENGAKTALIGCSIEPDNMCHGEVLGDLCQFDLITARESITYEALVKNGITKNTHLIPDSAFLLPQEPSKVILPKNTIGINISSIVLDTAGSIIYDNTIALINYILKNTEYHIALIPHVHQDFNDDYAALKQVYEHFTKDKRISLIDTNLNAPQLKDVVSQCRMLIAARTHCSIAGYSTCVPTLVLGYSVKSRGIATDLFGTSEGYVQAVQDLKTKNDFIKAFQWLEKNETSIKKHLTKIMPQYSEKAKKIKTYLDKLTDQKLPAYKYITPKTATIGKYQNRKLSIITSCYNSEKYLHRYLDSILNQTNHNVQLILVNDGSTDNTEKIILDYTPILEKKGVEVIYLKQPNGGIGSAYDLAIKYVSGEFFCWSDSDDFKSPVFTEKILNYFKDNPSHNILRFDAYFVPEVDAEKTDILSCKHFEKFSIFSPNPHEKNIFMNSLLEKNWHFGSTIVIKTKAFDEVSKRKIYHSRAGQNWQLCLPVLYKFESHYIADTLNYIVMRPNSISRSNSSTNNASALYSQMDEYKRILENVIKSMNLKNEKTLLKIIEQKYICKKLEIAQALNDLPKIQEFQKLFDEKVAPNNLYQKALDAIK